MNGSVRQLADFCKRGKETQKSGKDELKEVSMKELLHKNKLGEWHAYWLAEQIKWFKKSEVNKPLKNTFPSIKDVLKNVDWI